jgi:hypothetical protein
MGVARSIAVSCKEAKQGIRVAGLDWLCGKLQRTAPTCQSVQMVVHMVEVGCSLLALIVECAQRLAAAAAG